MSDHELILGDCLDPLRGLASLADKSVDHVICDPPYESEAHTKQRRMLYNGTRPRMEAAPLSFDAITEEQRRTVARECARICRGWILMFCQIEAVAVWRDTMEEAGAAWRRGGVWNKGGMPQLTGDRPAQGCECIAIAWAGEGRSTWNGGGTAGVWTYGHQSDGAENRVHPTQKPLALIEHLLRDFTQLGQLVCDPFAGSGTTLVAAKRLGRRAIGWEKDATFWERAVRRLENTRQQYELLPRGPKPRQVKMVLP